MLDAKFGHLSGFEKKVTVYLPKTTAYKMVATFY